MTQSQLFNHLSGAQASCSRCGELCKVADATNKDARLLKHAATPENGHCVNCGVVEWFWVMDMRRLVTDPKALALPHVQAQFAAVMKAGKADAPSVAIRWERVIATWNMPFVIGKRSYDPNKPLPGRRK